MLFVPCGGDVADGVSWLHVEAVGDKGFDIASPADRVPLCVDLDGTLISSDSLVQGISVFLRRDPRNLIWVLGWCFRGRAMLKTRIGEQVLPDAASLPYHRELLAYLRAEFLRGRCLVLCTAANERVASSVAEHLGIFSMVFSSNGKENLKGRAKMKVLERRFGARQFDYAGDSWADISVWRGARSAIIVNASPWIFLALRILGVSVSRSFRKSVLRP